MTKKREIKDEKQKKESMHEKSAINYEKISKSQVEKHVLLKRRRNQSESEDPKPYHLYKKRIVGKCNFDN